MRDKDIPKCEIEVLRHYRGSKYYKLWKNGMDKLKGCGVDKTLKGLEEEGMNVSSIYSLLLEYYLNSEIPEDSPSLRLRTRGKKLKDLASVINDIDTYGHFLGFVGTLDPMPPVIMEDGKGNLEFHEGFDKADGWLDSIKAELEELHKQLKEIGFHEGSVYAGRPVPYKLPCTAYTLAAILKGYKCKYHWKVASDILSPLTGLKESRLDLEDKVRKFRTRHPKRSKSIFRALLLRY
jgi:hypothetical protein